MSQITDRLLKLFDIDNLLKWLLDVLLPNLVAALVVFSIFYVIWKLIKRALRILQVRAKLDETIASFLETVIKYIILSYAFVAAMSQFGVNVASFLTGLGIAGLTIGFAAKDALSNIISGLFIFWDRPFVIGDLVEIGNHYGRVDQITMRSTRVVTVDGKMLAIPNSVVVNSPVASFTNFPHLRLDIDVTIGVDENLLRVRKILLDLVKDAAVFMSEPPPSVLVVALNDYNIAVQLQVWIRNEREHIKRRAELREDVVESFRKFEVHMPYETIVVKS